MPCRARTPGSPSRRTSAGRGTERSSSCPTADRGRAASRGERCASRRCGPSRPWWPWPRTGRRRSAAGRSPWPAAPPSSRGEPRRRHERAGTGCRCRGTRRSRRRRLGGTVEVQDTGDRLVEQFEVVADHQQRTLVLTQESEQPRLCVDVEVVGRLVEAQHVGAGEQDPRQLDASPLATRQRADRLIESGVGDPESGRHRPRLALGRRIRRWCGRPPRRRCTGSRCARRGSPPWRCAASRCG